jgi:hypothetical protein
MSLRRFDAFSKTRPDLTQKSATGGLITLIASTTALLLFLGQIMVYVLGNSHHHLTLSRSISVPLLPVQYNGGAKHPNNNNNKIAHQVLWHSGKTHLHIHVTFPHLNCDKLDVLHDGASLRAGEIDQILGPHSLVTRPPNSYERKVFETLPAHHKSGCTIHGHLRPNIVAGTFQITISSRAWQEATNEISMLRLTGGGSHVNNAAIAEQLGHYNVSHYIHAIEFGKPYSKAQDKQPLINRYHRIENEYGGIAVEQIQVKLVPTVNSGIFFSEFSYQTSVVDHTIQPSTLVSRGVPNLPGLVMSYDFTPLTVHHSDGRENLLVFLSSLISIVAGVFVTVSLLTGCLFESASVISKKSD